MILAIEVIKKLSWVLGQVKAQTNSPRIGLFPDSIANLITIFNNCLSFQKLAHKFCIVTNCIGSQLKFGVSWLWRLLCLSTTYHIAPPPAHLPPPEPRGPSVPPSHLDPLSTGNVVRKKKKKRIQASLSSANIEQSPVVVPSPVNHRPKPDSASSSRSRANRGNSASRQQVDQANGRPGSRNTNHEGWQQQERQEPFSQCLLGWIAALI